MTEATYHQNSETAGPLEFLKRPVVQIAIIALVALIAYSNSFHVPFIFDDETSITKNEVVHNLGNFFLNSSGYDDLPNRYIAYLSFALNYYFNGTEVAGYHLVNLLIHIINGLLVFSLVRLTLGTPFFRRDGHSEVPERLSLLPFVAGLLFVCHPIQTQAVTYIVQRLTSLTTLFYLATLILYIRWRSVRETGASLTSGGVLPWYVLSLVTAILAMKTKEIAFTLPMIVLLYEFSFFGRPNGKHLLSLAPLMLTLCIIPASMLSLKKAAGEILSDVSKVTSAESTLSRWEYLCTQFSVIVTYIRQLFLPYNQNLDYDYPANHSLAEPRAFLALLLLLALFALAVYLFRRSGSAASFPLKASRLVAFGIIWFFVTLAVESSLIPIADVIFEHRLYLPSVGFFLAALTAGAIALAQWKDSLQARKAATAFVVVAAILLTGATYSRNQVWQSWETMWKDVKKKSPMKPRAYNNLGAYYVKTDRPVQAIREFEISVRLNPQYLDSLYNLAMLYVWARRFEEAKRISETLQRLDPETFKELDRMYGNR